jgi:hypothetical protein
MELCSRHVEVVKSDNAMCSVASNEKREKKLFVLAFFYHWEKSSVLYAFIHKILLSSEWVGGMRDVKYLHKSCNTKKNPFIKWGMQQVVFFPQSTRVHNMKRKNKKSDYIKVFLFIFSFYYFFFSSSFALLCFRSLSVRKKFSCWFCLLNEKLW